MQCQVWLSLCHALTACASCICHSLANASGTPGLLLHGDSRCSVSGKASLLMENMMHLKVGWVVHNSQKSLLPVTGHNFLTLLISLLHCWIDVITTYTHGCAPTQHSGCYSNGCSRFLPFGWSDSHLCCQICLSSIGHTCINNKHTLCCAAQQHNT